MTRRGLASLAGITGVVVLLAFWLSVGGPGEGISQQAGQPLFPGLGEKLAAAEAINFSGRDGVTSLSLQEGRWTVDERFGYSADRAQVRALLSGLVRSLRLEPKTADPDRLGRIGLGEDALHLSVTGSDGTKMVALRIGDAREPGGAGERKTFVWVDGDKRSWLVSSLPALTASPILWLERTIIELSDSRISGVTITRSDGDDLSLTGHANNVAALAVAGQTAAEELVGAAANETMTALANLRFDDLAPAEEITGAPLATALYRTFDGLIVRIEVLESESGTYWATFDATYDADAMLEAGTPSLMPDAPADGAAEADLLNARWGGWAYQLPEDEAKAITRRRSDVLRAIEDDEAVAAEAD